MLKKCFTICAIITLLSITFFVAGCGKKEVVQNEEHKMPVETSKVEKRDIIYKTSATGSISAKKDVSVVPKIGGKVEKVYVKVGQKVNKGEKLVKLEQDEINLRIKQAQAGLAAAKAGESLSISQFENAETNLDRIEKLYEEGAVSKQQLDQAKLQYDVSSTESAESQVKNAEAALEMAKYQLENSLIDSPINGIVTSVNIEEGEMASPGMPVVRVVNMDKVYLESAITEDQVNKLKEGQVVKVNIGAVSKDLIEGKITSVSPAADLQTKAYPIKIELNNSDYIIKPGMFAEADLPLEHKKQVVAVPLSSVIERNEKQGVFIVNEGNAVFKEIIKGIDDGIYIEIKKGLTEGDELIVVGHHALTDKTSVKVIERGEE